MKVGQITYVEDQSNGWIIARLVQNEITLHDAPARRDRRKSEDLPWALAEAMIKKCRKELALRRDPAYVERRRRHVLSVYKTEDAGIEIVS